MSNIGEFKEFVKTKPSLISFVHNGDMTWQKFYELWSLYGPTNEVWNKYEKVAEKVVEKAASQKDAFGLGDVFNAIKNLDMEGVRKNITGVQKALGVIQDITGKGETNNQTTDTREPYNPRPMYRRFDD